jgi:hypothetical protein
MPEVDLSRRMGNRNDPALVGQLTCDARAAEKAGLAATPSFLIGKTGNVLRRLHYSSLTDPSSFNAAVEQLLRS